MPKDNNANAELGSLYRQKRKAEKRLLKRRNDAKHLVEPLRILAECFDEENVEANIQVVKGEEFWYWYREREGLIKESRGDKDPSVPFPIEAMDIATDIYQLEKEIEDLNERLELAIGCL